MNRALVRLISPAAAIVAMVPATIAVSGVSPEGARLLPDLDQEPPSGLILARGAHRWRLGFNSAVRNIGAGPLIIDGHRQSHTERTMDAEQMIRRTAGRREVVKSVGRLRYTRSPDHEHWHLLGFDHYELRRPSGARALVRDRKSGFCLGDRYLVTDPVLPARPRESVYRSRCGLERPGLMGVREGISVGYLAVLLIGFALWVSYGIVRHDLPLVVPNSVAFLVIVALASATSLKADRQASTAPGVASVDVRTLPATAYTVVEGIERPSHRPGNPVTEWLIRNREDSWPSR